MRIFYRVRQFFCSWRVRLVPEDYGLLVEYLNEGEQALFFRMAPADQRHCLDTAKSALGQEAAKSLDSEEFRLLLRSCLLHDVGKAAGDLGVWSRSIITMLLACSEGLVRRLAAYGANQQAGSFLWACYVHFQHPARGARWLADVGAERELLELVLYHHEDCYPGNNPLLLDILRRCDEMN